MRLLRRTIFGNPVLRQVARRLSVDEIKSQEIQDLIADMRHTVKEKKYGVGLAAPQVGESVALSVMTIRPTKNRPKVDTFEEVIINPEVIQTYGRKTGMWEGCLSFGLGDATPYAKAMRYEKIRGRYYDEHGELHEEDMDGIVAHVFQHETDHLNGVLFVDRVKDTTTYTTIGEYAKRRPK